MPQLLTVFGPLEYSERNILLFPAGLAGFEHLRQFVLLEPTELAPIALLESLEEPGIGFVTVPVELVDPGYEVAAIREDWTRVGGPEGVLCRVIVCLTDPLAPTANLLGPILVQPEKRLGVQAVRADNRYSARHPVPINKATPTSDGPTCHPEVQPCS